MYLKKHCDLSDFFLIHWQHLCKIYICYKNEEYSQYCLQHLKKTKNRLTAENNCDYTVWHFSRISMFAIPVTPNLFLQLIKKTDWSH